MEFDCKKELFRAVVAHGGGAIEELMKCYDYERLKGVDIVEMMLCPGGCINGGG